VPLSSELFANAAAAVAAAEAILITAGAGMGVDSGLPDFRGPEGFWRAYPPYRTLGLRFEQLANPAWFARDPELAWGFYGHRLNLYRNTLPHEGFAVLREWAATRDAFVFTSNVDGHFEKAGFDADRIYACHGSIHHLQCARPCCGDIWRADGMNVVVDDETGLAVGGLPICPSCGGVARPNILMFGDYSFLESRAEDAGRRYQRWLTSVAGKRVVVIECGAGLAVPTVRMESERIAKRLSGTLIRINVRDPDVPAGHVYIPLGAAEAISEIRNNLSLLQG